MNRFIYNSSSSNKPAYLPNAYCESGQFYIANASHCANSNGNIFFSCAGRNNSSNNGIISIPSSGVSGDNYGNVDGFNLNYNGYYSLQLNLYFPQSNVGKPQGPLTNYVNLILTTNNGSLQNIQGSSTPGFYQTSVQPMGVDVSFGATKH